METNRIYFKDFLNTAFDKGDYQTDDVIAFVLPVFREVLSFHEEELVAPFEKTETLFITGQCLDVDENYAHPPQKNTGAVNALLQKYANHSFDIVGNYKVEEDVDSGVQQVENAAIIRDITQPVTEAGYIQGYHCFELLLNHHDQQTDIYFLGLILASMAMGLDLNDEDDFKHFIDFRSRPSQYYERIHPAVSALITEMTELDRHKRSQDLYDIIQRLENYRDYDPEKQADLSQVTGWVNKNLEDRSRFILNKLRNRLFDTSRRNRLLYYKPNARFVNLTVGSVPIVLHYQSIRPEMLFTWNGEIASKVSSGKDIQLNKYLRFEDHNYLSNALNKVRVEAQRDEQEFGFSQLKLVPCFLNWHNLKEDKHERIQSPLLLVSVELKKTKNLNQDNFTLQIKDTVAEVNPVLANFLRELYGIRLPDFIDLEETDLTAFYQTLKARIDGAQQGVSLTYIDKPKIRFVHSVARQTVSRYRKRLKNQGVATSYKNIAYSYQKENFKPLGLEIFRQRVEQKYTFLELLVNDDILLSSFHLTGDGMISKEREMYNIAESEDNPYSWDFDICNVVLGNFNYKKMSLVRDYNQVIDLGVQNDVFENLFSAEPKNYRAEEYNLDKTDDWHHVVTADPTQTRAILKSRTGDSYIIQGPPGTGKSQTITNLIADFVARGKTILFVCEKRAALDVVFYRLKQQGLDELCCYIHDSQADKREFVKNLKATYEDFTRNRMPLAEIEKTRTEVIASMTLSLQLLAQFHALHTSSRHDTGIQLRQMLERLILLKDETPALAPMQEELVPHYNDWIKFGEQIERLSASLEDSGTDDAFADHPFSQIRESVYQHEQPYTFLHGLLAESTGIIRNIKEVLSERYVPDALVSDWASLNVFVDNAVALHPLVVSRNLQLIENTGGEARAFDEDLKAHALLQEVYHQKQEKNANWTNKFSEEDARQGLEIALKKEKSLFRFLSSSWKNLKKQVEASYQLRNHQVKPSVTMLLQQLMQEYDAGNAVAANRKKLESKYHVSDLDVLNENVVKLRSRPSHPSVEFLLKDMEAGLLIEKISQLQPLIGRLKTTLLQFLVDFEEKSLAAIDDETENIQMNLDSFADMLPALKAFAVLPEPLRKMLRRIPLTPSEAEAVMADKTLKDIYRSDKAFAEMGMVMIEDLVSKIRTGYIQMLALNAQNIRAGIRQRFLHHLDLSNMAVSQLNAEQREFKKEYNDGRKILENEFGKSMRYKSIRELAEKESGTVLKDLKPVWLMSPLSVSDSLPLSTAYFDVIIFDEASQITLEEGIPSLYRAPQTIIVGDDKQMPPSSFFSAKAEDPDDLETMTEFEDDEWLSNDTDSLLVQGARKLDSVMLGWHYRSRYETLISYSNHAFYNAGLLTIPDKTVHHTEKRDLLVDSATQAVANAKALYDRSISFHHLHTGLYESRANKNEAEYIAHLVRELLVQKKKESIGIVAFSQEQQNTIENALEALAAEDKQFEQLLEEAYNRTEDDQFVGLFVKNLENVQGDERDIIIMSICYGFDSRKKMIMNFGPINKKGGEKRLNVIFSRAKKHMAVISSIRHFNITNEYNEGAGYFKRFLHYAELVSTGNMAMARTVLDSLVAQKQVVNTGEVKKQTAVAVRIKSMLEERGYLVDEHVGQSDFKCSLAVKIKAEDEEYSLSILVDDVGYYANRNVLEQYYQRPDILKNFGWKIITVFAKDWIADPGKVTERIIRKLGEENKTPDKVEVHRFTMTNTKPAESADSSGISGSPYDHLEFTTLVYTDEKSSKFWEIASEDTKLVIRYGKSGTRGQTQIKTFPDVQILQKEMAKLVKAKLDKGYEKLT